VIAVATNHRSEIRFPRITDQTFVDKRLLFREEFGWNRGQSKTRPKNLVFKNN